MLVDPPALRAGFLLPAGDGALIEVEGDDNSLHRTAVGKQRHDCEHQPPRLVHPVEGGVFGLGEGPPTAFAAITALFVAMDHEVALSRTTVGAAAPVVTELLVRVHADTHPLFGGQRPNKDAAGPAYSSTQPSSTLPWGATSKTSLSPIHREFITAPYDREKNRQPARGLLEAKESKIQRLITLALAIAVVVLLASGIARAAATTETDVYRQPESFTIDNPCQGYEVPILVEGVFQYVYRVTSVGEDPINPDFYYFLIHANASNVTGTGLETGDEYRFINGIVSTGSGSPGPSGSQFTYNVRYIIVSDGASPNFIYHEVLRQVIAPDGQPFITIEKYWATCTAGVQT